MPCTSVILRPGPDHGPPRPPPPAGLDPPAADSGMHGRVVRELVRGPASGGPLGAGGGGPASGGAAPVPRRAAAPFAAGVRLPYPRPAEGGPR